MKNRRITDAWNKIEPDSAAEARMLEAILAKNQPKTREVYPMNRTIKRLVPIAACLALAIAAAVAIPRFTAKPPVVPPGTEQVVTLPAMLAGQAVTWEAFPDDAEPGIPIKWSVKVTTADGALLEMGDTEMKILGLLADGRKITVAREEVSRVPQAKETAGPGVLLSVPDLESALEIGSTVMQIAFTDDGWTTTYRCYIQAIE